MRFQGGICPEKFNLIKFKMADLWRLLIVLCILFGKPFQITRSLQWNEICGFMGGGGGEGVCLEKCQFNQI